MVVQHTQCGMTEASDEQFAGVPTEATGHAPDDVTIHAIENPVVNLQADVEALTRSPFLAGVDGRGFLYDIATGLLYAATPATRP